ncbi:MAG TPA: hypothetical protein ENI74_02735 [Gammaproteobacteria bacterium]|nr:hypothetical protein [Gammaproteobacteria bacterium]
MRTIPTALKTVLGLRRYRFIAAAGFLVFLALYLMTLPSSYTGGQIGPAALHYLDATMASLAVLMALLAGLLMPLMVYLIRRGQPTSKTSLGGGVLVGILTPMLCCSTLLPVALGVVVSVVPSLAGRIGLGPQRFIATHQTALMLAAALLLLVALYQNARKINNSGGCRVRA